jgi:predicted dehydrogenase
VIEIGLVGCGRVAHDIYTKTLRGRSAYRVRFVVDTDPAQARSAAELFGAEVAELGEVIEKAGAIFVSTPPSTHGDLVRRCLRPGGLILCEKPYMASYEDAQAVTEAAREVGARLYVNHFRRVFPQVELARDLVRLGVIGEVSEVRAAEGGRFVWDAVSGYTLREPTGGVLWDTGSHTLDMVLHAAGLDGHATVDVSNIRVRRDKPEPSHDFRALFDFEVEGRPIRARLDLSRKEALPNFVVLTGSEGEIGFVTDVDDRVRLTTRRGTTVLHADRSYDYAWECFDVAFRRILLAEETAGAFAAETVVGQIKLLEAVSRG